MSQTYLKTNISHRRPPRSLMWCDGQKLKHLFQAINEIKIPQIIFKYRLQAKNRHFWHWNYRKVVGACIGCRFEWALTFQLTTRTGRFWTNSWRFDICKCKPIWIARLRILAAYKWCTFGVSNSTLLSDPFAFFVIIDHAKLRQLSDMCFVLTPNSTHAKNIPGGTPPRSNYYYYYYYYYHYYYYYYY